MKLMWLTDLHLDRVEKRVRALDFEEENLTFRFRQ